MVSTGVRTILTGSHPAVTKFIKLLLLTFPSHITGVYLSLMSLTARCTEHLHQVFSDNECVLLAQGFATVSVNLKIAAGADPGIFEWL